MNPLIDFQFYPLSKFLHHPTVGSYTNVQVSSQCSPHYCRFYPYCIMSISLLKHLNRGSSLALGIKDMPHIFLQIWILSSSRIRSQGLKTELSHSICLDGRLKLISNIDGTGTGICEYPTHWLSSRRHIMFPVKMQVLIAPR